MENFRFELLTETCNLFIETIGLSEMNGDEAEYNYLYDKECRLFELIPQLNARELKCYQKVVAQEEFNGFYKNLDRIRKFTESILTT